MGTDIHTSVCVRSRSNSTKFEPVAMMMYRGFYNGYVNAFDYRAYNFFAAIAGVRGESVLGLNPKGRFDINEIEWPIMDQLIKVGLPTNIAKLNAQIVAYQNDEPADLTNQQKEFIRQIEGFGNTFDYFDDESFLHSHTWFTVKELKKLRKKLENMIVQYNNEDVIPDAEYTQELRDIITSLNVMIKNAKRIAGLYHHNRLEFEEYNDSDILVLIAFDS